MLSDVLLLILGLSSVLGDVIPKQKPGSCPKPLDYYPCVLDVKDGCAIDWECKGTYKCCLYQCRRQCVFPIGAKTNPCPDNTYDPASTCLDKKYANECGNDNQCPGTERCCCAGCVRKCTQTILVKPGKCPNLNIVLEPCNACYPDKCANDQECGDDLKCCNNGCMKHCVKPVFV